MKHNRIAYALVIALAGTALVTGCKKKEEAAAPPPAAERQTAPELSAP